MDTGKIGCIAAQIFRGFGARVLAFDLAPHHAWAAAHGIEYADPDTLLEQGDVLSLHLFSEETFCKLKPGAFLINTSRGKLIDTTALIQTLKPETSAAWRWMSTRKRKACSSRIFRIGFCRTMS